MIVALGFCHKDYLSAEKLFRWTAELEGQKINHPLILVSANGVETRFIRIVSLAAQAAFKSVDSVMPRVPDERGWPISSNHLFLTAYHFAKKKGASSMLWIEPDCTPLKAGWVDSLETEYIACRKPFMGCVYELPMPHLTGCAIYPMNIEKYSPGVMKPDIHAWDMVDADSTIANAHHSAQFQHEWGNFKYNIAPTFPSQASVGFVRPDAAIFHRCKDGSLIDRLRERKQWPRICNILAKIGKASNGFQDFEDSHAPAAVQMAA